MNRLSQAWIFVSHSTRDLEKVRLVRNAIETADGEPILFFLKCLSEHDEIDGLIKREIDARNFFLLCDSHNAKSSRWVQDEVAYVKSLENKIIESIDLDGDWSAQLRGIQAIVQHATVFLSYAAADEQVIAPVKSALIANDFSVWDPSRDIQGGDTIFEQISSTIEDAAKFGFFIHFLSRRSIGSKWVGYEANEMLQRTMENRYIPILLEPESDIGDQIPEFARERQWIDYSDRNIKAFMPHLLKALGVRSTEQAAPVDARSSRD